MRGLAIFCLICTSAWPAMSQSRFRNGFVLTNANDTLRGLISTRNEEICNFKKNKNDTVATEYKPGEIREYGFMGGKYFITRSIGKTEDVFLEVLVRGAASLYKYREAFFVEKGDSVFYELSIDKDVVTIYGQRIKKKSTNYYQMLSLVLFDCKTIKEDLEDIDFKEKDFRRLFRKYNTCVGSKSVSYGGD